MITKEARKSFPELFPQVENPPVEIVGISIYDLRIKIYNHELWH